MNTFNYQLSIILAVIALIVLVKAIWIIRFYNGVKKRENNIEDSFAQLDVQLKRRNDLIPNLIETVKGATSHESKTLQEVINARTAAVQAGTVAEKLAANSALSATLGKLQVVLEAYPDLKANAAFIQLNDNLSETENKIAHFRQFYNDAILLYNRLIATFPNLILAKLFRFRRKEYLVTKDAEKEVVAVKF